MAGELMTAVNRLEGRKQAAGVSDQQRAPEDAVRFVLAEFDLDLDELKEIRMAVAGSGIRAAASGFSLVEIVDATWVDGLITGLMLAEERQKAGQSS